jgi:CRISPR-associated protein Cmr2
MIKQKLKAFFHDPIDKIFNIQFHRNKAVEYANLAGIEENLFEEDIEKSDQIAAAADRINLSENISVDFNRNAELTHPLGSGNVKLAGEEYGYVSPQYDEIERVITEVINKFKNSCKDNNKKLLLTLWRNIPEELTHFEHDKFKLGNLWNLLPADSRIPDHSILDHNWLSSAICGSLPNLAFLKFSIGPVQNFILNAKRTEDYWAGSYILSYLSSKAIEIIIDELGPEHIIFPYIKGQPLIDKFLKEKYSIEITEENVKDLVKISSLSNIIFAILPYEKTKEIAEKMKGNVKNSFKTLADEIKNKFSEFFSDETIRNIWDKQIDDFIEVYYVIYKWPNNIEELKQQYKEIFGIEPSLTEGIYQSNIGNYWQHMYRIIDSAFNSRKNLRNFEQLKSEDEVVKCSICGEREVLHPKDVKKTSKLTEFWGKIGEREKEKGTYKIDIKGRDKLCAICFIKRMAGEYYFKEKVFKDSVRINYPSTSTIASLPFKIKVIESSNRNGVLPLVDKYNNLLTKLGISGNFNWQDIKYLRNLMRKFANNNEFKVFDDFLSFDGQWLYEESFTEKCLTENGIVKDKEEYNSKKSDIKEIKWILSELSKIINDKPSKYFAVLRMDGDKMGEWLSGTHPQWPKWKDVVHSEVEKFLDENIKNEKRNLSPAIHSFISKCLNFFSLKLVRNIVETEFPGKLVYSGGDDLLAFLPMDCVLKAAEKIRFTFSGNLNEKGEIDLNHTNGYILIKNEENKKIIIPTLGNNATISAGIVIAHKNHNLSDVLKNAEEALNQAKDIDDDKDAFAIKILKHSGTITEYRSKWKLNNIRVMDNINVILENIVEENSKDGLSMSFFQSMFDDIRRLPYDNITLTKSILQLKLKRHIHLNRKQNETEEQLKQRKTQLVEKMKNLFNIFIENQRDEKSFENFLLVLRFLATGGKR